MQTTKQTKEKISPLRAALAHIANGEYVLRAEEVDAIRGYVILSREHARKMLAAGFGL